MGEMGDFFRGMKEERQRRRAKYGVPCPECQRLLPKANPAILLPGQRCGIHRKHKDPRPWVDYSKETTGE